MIDSERIAAIHGRLVDLAHTTIHTVALAVLAGTVRFLASTMKQTYAKFDLELPGMTLLVFDLYNLLAAHPYLLVVLLAVDYGLLRLGRRLSRNGRTAIAYSIGVLLLIIFVLGFAVVGLVHPWARLVSVKGAVP